MKISRLVRALAMHMFISCVTFNKKKTMTLEMMKAMRQILCLFLISLSWLLLSSAPLAAR